MEVTILGDSDLNDRKDYLTLSCIFEGGMASILGCV